MNHNPQPMLAPGGVSIQNDVLIARISRVQRHEDEARGLRARASETRAAAAQYDARLEYLRAVEAVARGTQSGSIAQAEYDRGELHKQAEGYDAQAAACDARARAEQERIKSEPMTLADKFAAAKLGKSESELEWDERAVSVIGNTITLASGQTMPVTGGVVASASRGVAEREREERRAARAAQRAARAQRSAERAAGRAAERVGDPRRPASPLEAALSGDRQ